METKNPQGKTAGFRTEKNKEHYVSKPNHTRTKKSRKLTKTLKIFAVLASGASLNRFQAEIIGDHALHSTVSTIQKKYGVTIKRKFINVKTRFTEKTPVCKYWIAPDAQASARDIVLNEFVVRKLAGSFYSAQKLFDRVVRK